MLLCQSTVVGGFEIIPFDHKKLTVVSNHSSIPVVMVKQEISDIIAVQNTV